MKLSIVFTVFLGFTLASCADEVNPENPAEINTPVVPENIAYATFGDFTDGVLIDSVYGSAFFGFELPILEGWDIILVNNTRFDYEKDSLASDGLKNDLSEDNYFQLITLQMNDRIPLVNFMVEKIDPIPNVTNAKEYLAYTETYILEGHTVGFPHYIAHAVTESPVGGRPFMNQTFSVEYENASQFQRNYCVQFDAYIFTIITHYSNQAELDVINELLSGIRWKTVD